MYFLEANCLTTGVVGCLDIPDVEHDVLDEYEQIGDFCFYIFFHSSGKGSLRQSQYVSVQYVEPRNLELQRV